ncbi:MAG: ABC-F family ATP-binding cassette domain-containing protein [Candidatus Promineifilaceae bacterium]|nr:ABC-F family ATP-binding cassette domain-containing protein [Candidatus Promineifilaceae bacterium]
MPLLRTVDLGHSFGARELFAGVELRLETRDRVALVGPNGVGKTTLLLLLAGEIRPSAGHILREEDFTLGVLRQEAVLTFAGQDNTVFEEMQSVFSDLREQEVQLRKMEKALGAGDTSDALLEAYGELQQAFDMAGGYGYEVEIKRVLQGLGFAPEEWHLPLSHLSGGQKTRLLLGRLLLEKPDLLILDEPTNHLDMEAIRWLERTLRHWLGALIIVSHDRYFLDAVAGKVWDMDQGRVTTYRGNYSSYVRQRRESWEREQNLFAAEKERMEAELAFIRKHIAGGKSDIAKGKLKRLTRDIVLIEQVGVTAKEGKSWSEVGGRVRTMSANEATHRLGQLRAPNDGPPPLTIRLQPEQRSARGVLRAGELIVGYEGKPLFLSGPFQLERRDCAALLGPNGSGKSTFLRTIMGEIRPLRGSLKFGDGVEPGYFAQAHEQLDERKTVLDELLAAKPISPEDGRKYLASYLFRGDDVFKQVAALSGGERARLALALLAAAGANLLLLDEPTNHLDIPSQEILQSVLEQFDGTILLVSHDRYLVSRLATQVWEIEDEQMQVFEGKYEDYLRFREAGEEGFIPGPDDEQGRALDWVADVAPPPVGKKAQRELQHRRYVLQGVIEDTEFQIQQLDYQLARAEEGSAASIELQTELAEAKERLEALNDELDALH